jgi:YHS domain-containing protein
MKNLKLFYMLIIAVVTIASVFVSPVWSKSRINTNWRGVAIQGYDPVAYFTLGKPTKGSAEFELEWMGAKWRFSSARHMNLFKSDPEKYAPQYGGY